MASTGNRLDVLDPGTPSDQWAQGVLNNTVSSNTYTSADYGSAGSAAYNNTSSASNPVGATFDSAADRIAGSDRPAAGRGGSGQLTVGVDTVRPTTSLATSLNQGYQQIPTTTSAITEPGPNVSVLSNSTATGTGRFQSGSDRIGTAGNFGADYSSRTQGALQADPSSTDTEDVLSTQPKKSTPGQPIVDPLSHRPENQTSAGTDFISDIGAQSNSGLQEWNAGADSGTAAGGMSREPVSSGVPNEPSAKTLSAVQAPADQMTADIIGAEPNKWRNAQPAATGNDSLPAMGEDAITSSGAISSDPSARTRAALSTDPSTSTTHSVLGSQPKQTAPGEPIVPPKSTSLDDQSSTGFGTGYGGQGASGDNAYLSGSSDPTQPFGEEGITGGSTGGVPGVEKRTTGITAEPSARTKAALGQTY